jgi:uncharacterized protein
MLLSIGFEASLGGLAWLLGWLIGQPPLDRFSFDGQAVLLGTVATLPMLLGFLACLRWSYGPMRNIRAFVDEALRPLLEPCTLLDLAVLSLVAGAGEEMLFRGVLQTACGHWLGVWPGLVVASLVFGLVHPINWLYIILAALCGAYLGVLYLASANLLAPVLTHALYDFVVLVYILRRPVSPADGPAQPGA